MDPIALVIIGVAVAGIAWFTLFRDNDTTEFSEPTPVAPPVAPPVKPVSTVKHKVPAGAESLTKAQIEAQAREQGVELDKRMTKANMIADWKQKLK